MATSDETATTVMLRARYRCAQCHKRCLVPCRFTAAEFRQLERRTLAGSPLIDDPPTLPVDTGPP